MICELCFNPVVSIGYMAGGHARTLRGRLHASNTAVKVTDWPGTPDLPVWFHSRCYGATLENHDQAH